MPPWECAAVAQSQFEGTALQAPPVVGRLVWSYLCGTAGRSILPGAQMDKFVTLGTARVTLACSITPFPPKKKVGTTQWLT